MCVISLQVVEEHQEVNCSNFDEVTSFILSQYDSFVVQSLDEFRPDVVAVVEAHSVLQLLPGLIPTSAVADEGKDAWIGALIPESLHAPICNDDTYLCCR